MSKKLFFLILTILVTAFIKLTAAPIHSYQELKAAVCAGERFVIVVDLKKCSGNDGMPIGYFAPKAMMIVPSKETTLERVLTSDLHFSDHLSKPTYEYVKYTFNSDNTVVIHTTFYDPRDFSAFGTMHTVKSSLGNGIEIFTNNE